VTRLRIALGLLLLPLATGALVVTYQDASLTHWPGRAVTQAQLREGTFPFLHPGASCGQPLAGNPNYGVFFPDTLLLFVLPLPVAFGLRFALPLVLAFVGARRWARAEGAPREAAELAAVAFVLSGVFLSAWRFYNSGLALSLAPWVMAALVRLLRAAEHGQRGAGDSDGARRAAAELGLLAGLEVLAGEPVVVLLTAVIAAARFAASPRAWRRAGVPVTLATLVALLVAAPQIAATAQILPDSSRARTPFPFVVATGTSTHPVRLVEQVVPFPYGRPDLFGRFGFDAHEVFDHHAPYLWTLHLGLPVIGLLVMFGRPSSRHEAIYAALALVSVVLAFGRNLPGAKALYPLLSLDGRIRLPVKWWYVVALALVPLVASAAARWEGGQSLSRARRLLGFILLGGSGVVLAWQWTETMLASAGPALSLALLALLVFDRTPRRLATAASVLACALLLCHAPLLLALLDRPPDASPRVTTGRLLVRMAIDPHPVGGATFPSGTIRDFYRRGPAELWPLMASTVGPGYAFDEDPDGAYADEDRAIRKALEDLPWPVRAAELRIAGVTGIVTDEALGEPYREVRALNERAEVRLYSLDRPLPSVRFATRVFIEPSLDAVLALHRSADFDPATDVVLEKTSAAGGERLDVRAEILRETADRLVARVDSPAAGVLVWSRTFFSAWWATVDGAPAELVRADGHLVGVRVPAGAHDVEVGWSARPVVVGATLAVLGLGLAAWLRRSQA
jgi:hypothetical protein